MSDERFLVGNNDEGGYYSVSPDDLTELFDGDKVKGGESLQEIQQWGGFPGLEKKLKCDLQKGLNHSDATDLSSRELHFGSNQAITKPMKKIWDLITVQFEDEILRILCYAAGVSLIMGVATEGLKHGWMEGFAIFVAVIIIVSVTAINDYQKEKQFRKLYATAENRNVNVTRDGKVQNISVYDILVGDLLTIETGDILPVDGIITISHDILMDESSATGESDPIKKRVPQNFEDTKINPFMISGTQVLEGSGQFLVLCVGKHSQQGKAKLLLTEDDNDDPTPLQGKLDVLAGQIGNMGMLVAKLVFGAMCIHLLIDEIYHQNPIFTIENIQHVVEYFIIAVTVVVVAVPEGLPLAVTIALAYSVGKMKDENNLVRVLATCETMGGANNICSDKTGTLTKNDMEVTNLWAFQTSFDSFEKSTLANVEGAQEKLCVGVCVNSNAQPQIQGRRFEKIGNKTECALLEMAFRMGFNFEQYRPSDKIVRVIPFSSKKKRMSVIYQLNQDTYRIFVKGAPDWLASFCGYYLDKQGQKQPINEEFEEQRDRMIKKFADKALRTLLLCYKDVPASSMDAVEGDIELLENQIETDLIVLGVTGISDPIRPEVPDAVRKCKEAGVIVRMVTGDVKDTAIAISKKAGILDEDYDYEADKHVVMTGAEFREFVGGKKEIKSQDEDGNETTKYEVGNLYNFQIVYDKCRVIARSSPQDKFLLVTGIKQLGNVVAVTGDGTNDAPALKKADVGFAMGIAGTEVAKEAAGIILLDDNFSSILTAIKWGRNIFDCIRKFLQFQVTVNIVAMFMVFLGGVVLRESPLTSIQMLWVNLIMDTMASLALATEPPTDELLKRKPYGRHESMITPVMWRNIVCHGIWQILVLVIVLFKGHSIFEVPYGIGNHKWTQENGQHFTMFFNIFVYMQVFNEINARKLKKDEKNVFKGFFNNPMFISVIVITIGVQMFITTYGGRALKCSELDMHQHIVCLFIGMLSLVVGFVIKLIPEGLFNTISLFNAPAEETGKPNIIQTLRRSRSIVHRSSSHLSRQKSIKRA